MITPQNHQPFWKDEPDFQLYSQPTWKRIFPLVKIYGLIVTFFFSSLVFFSFYIVAPILAWIWLVVLAIMFSSGYFRGKRRKIEIQGILQTQKQAHDLTGASIIGSTTHMAGHPQLEREQNIVMALIVPNLVIYSYQSDQPLVIIPLQDIVRVQTVAYDDDRVPHTDVIDSSAQAIQLTIKYGKQDFSCLFRQMKKIRPIDWYHAIQKARMQINDEAG